MIPTPEVRAALIEEGFCVCPVCSTVLGEHKKRQTPRIADIQKLVALEFGIPAREMLSARRAQAVARPRQIAMYLAKELTMHSLPMIGRAFGGRDHTTILHGIRRVKNRADTEIAFAAVVESLRLRAKALAL